MRRALVIRGHCDGVKIPDNARRMPDRFCIRLMPVSISDEVADQKRLKRDEEEASTAVELAIFTFYQGSLLSMLRFLVC